VHFQYKTQAVDEFILKKAQCILWPVSTIYIGIYAKTLKCY